MSTSIGTNASSSFSDKFQSYGTRSNSSLVSEESFGSSSIREDGYHYDGLRDKSQRGLGKLRKLKQRTKGVFHRNDKVGSNEVYHKGPDDTLERESSDGLSFHIIPDSTENSVQGDLFRRSK